MKRLVLMRHAKSAWDDPMIADHDRPLNQRGRLAASLMGAWFADQPWTIDAAIVSTSVRTRETWDRIAAMIDAPPSPRFDRSIYEAAPEALMSALRAAPPAAETVLMLGHNPGSEVFADMIVAPAGPRAGRFATAAVAVMETDQEWRDVDRGGFRLIAFEVPKTLV